MITQKLLDSRKSCFDYQVSLNETLNELIEPLLQLNIDRFFYGKFYLDDQQMCKTAFYLDSDLRGAQWFCSNVVDNGVDYTTALRQTPLNQDSYFTLPKNTSDYIIRAWHTLGCLDALTVYNRKNESVEFWDFSSTYDTSLLSGNVLSSQTLDVLLKFRAYFDRKLLDLDLQYQVKFHYPKGMNFSLLPQQSKDLSKFIEFLQPYHNLMQLNGEKFKLSKREWECWKLLALGQSVKRIANDLDGLSPRTVESYIESLKQKIGCYNKTSLAKLFSENFKDWI